MKQKKKKADSGIKERCKACGYFIDIRNEAWIYIPLGRYHDRCLPKEFKSEKYY